MLENLQRDLDDLRNFRQESSKHPTLLTTTSSESDTSSKSTPTITHSTHSTTTSPELTTTSKSTSAIPKNIPSVVLMQQFPGKVTYTYNETCQNPYVHKYKVHIEGYSDNDNWQGNGLQKKGAKEKAAYETIKSDFKELLDLTSYDDQEFNVNCTKPTSTS